MAVNQAWTGSVRKSQVLVIRGVQVWVFLEIHLLIEVVAERLVVGEAGTDVWVVRTED